MPAPKWAIDKIEELLEELRSSGLIEDWARCPGTDHYDIFEEDPCAPVVQIKVIG